MPNNHKNRRVVTTTTTSAITILPPNKPKGSPTGRGKGKPFRKKEDGPLPYQKSWQPGQSGFAGRRHAPPQNIDSLAQQRETAEMTKKISEAYHINLTEPCSLPGYQHLTWANAIAVGIMTEAALGDVPAAREVREVTEGKLSDRMELTGKDGEAINQLPPIIEVVFVKPNAKLDEENT